MTPVSLFFANTVTLVAARRRLRHLDEREHERSGEHGRDHDAELCGDGWRGEGGTRGRVGSETQGGRSLCVRAGSAATLQTVTGSGGTGRVTAQHLDASATPLARDDATSYGVV